MAGGIVTHPAVRDRVPDFDDWGIVSRVIGGGGFLITDQLRPAFSAVTAVGRTTVPFVALVASGARRGLFIQNNSQGILFIKLGVGVLSTSFTVRINRQGFYEAQWPNFTGIVTGVWSTAGAGDAQITETF